MNCKLLILLLLLNGLFPLNSFTQGPGTRSMKGDPESPYVRITELKPGDILVKPNHNWIPGSSFVPGGSKFGHAAIVIKGASDTLIERLLTKSVLFESHARDVPGEFQLRRVPGYFPGTDFRFANISFGQHFAPYRYRLRPNLTDKQIEAILKFITDRDNDESSWRALKKIPKSGSGSSARQTWYCSLLIWQAFYEVIGVDLDGNEGVYVFPNDLISSHFFDNKPGKYNRVRF